MGIPFSDKPSTDTSARYPEVPTWSEAVPNPQAKKIEELCDAATNYKRAGQYDEAESALNEAVALNEPYFNPSMYRYLIEELLGIYRARHKSSDVLDKVYQTESKRLGLWSSPEFREQIADFYLQQKRFAEAWAILRHKASTLKPPRPGGFCGVPYYAYSQERARLDACERGAEGLSQAKLDQIEADIETRYSQSPSKRTNK